MTQSYARYQDAYVSASDVQTFLVRDDRCSLTEWLQSVDLARDKTLLLDNVDKRAKIEKALRLLDQQIRSKAVLIDESLLIQIANQANLYRALSIHGKYFVFWSCILGDGYLRTVHSQRLSN